MITEVTFQQPICIGRTNTREHRFRSDDGWRIEIDDRDVFLTHVVGDVTKWQFRVRNVGFTYVETPDKEDHEDGELAMERLKSKEKNVPYDKIRDELGLSKKGKGK